MAPGIVFVFKDKFLEQKFHLNRTSSKRSVLRLSRTRKEKTVKPKRNKKLEKYEKNSDLLEGLWLRWLELGRKPKIDEIESADEITDQFGTLGKALKFLIEFKDAALEEGRGDCEE